MVSFCICPCKSYSTGSCVGTILAKSNHLCTWDHLNNFFSDFDLYFMGKTEYRAFFELCLYCFRNIRIIIAKGNRGKSIYKINIFIAIYVPYMRAITSFYKMRRYPFRICCFAFTKSLRPSGIVFNALSSICRDDLYRSVNILIFQHRGKLHKA